MLLARSLSLALSFAAAPLLAGAQSPTSERGAPEIETVGVGERRVAPDRANVMLFIETKAPTASRAASLNAQAVQAVRDTLKAMGLDSAATTASYNVGPNWEPSPGGREPQRVGYAARTSIRVELRRLEAVGRVIDAALARGATGVENVWFESSRTEALRREALADAAVAAKRDAEALAASLGGALGAMRSASTVGAQDPRRVNVAMAMGEIAGGRAMLSSTQVAPNEIVIRAAVQGRWEFVPR